MTRNLLTDCKIDLLRLYQVEQGLPLALSIIHPPTTPPRIFLVNKLLAPTILSRCSGLAVNVVEPASALLVIADIVIA